MTGFYSLQGKQICMTSFFNKIKKTLYHWRMVRAFINETVPQWIGSKVAKDLSLRNYMCFPHLFRPSLNIKKICLSSVSKFIIIIRACCWTFKEFNLFSVIEFQSFIIVQNYLCKLECINPKYMLMTSQIHVSNYTV